MQTSTKANAAAVAGWLTTIVLWAVSTIPGWESIPLEPKAAIVSLIAAGISYLAVYFAPANRDVVEPEQSTRILQVQP